MLAKNLFHVHSILKGFFFSGKITNRNYFKTNTIYHYKYSQGLGTDDRTLIRVVVSRCEVDMKQIKAEFQKRYGKQLESFVRVSNVLVYFCIYFNYRKGK